LTGLAVEVCLLGTFAGTDTVGAAAAPLDVPDSTIFGGGTGE